MTMIGNVEMIGIFVGILAIMAVVIYIKANMKICEPNEVMIFTGRTFREKDKTMGYRVIKGGRAMKIPLIETVRTLSLNTMPIELDVRGALTRGTIPVNVKAMANVKIAGTMEEGLGNAIERFLGKSNAVIAATAREILEGSLRGILATMEPEEANAQRIVLAKQVFADVREDMQRMGLVLDMFKIPEIKDDKGYLEAIARKKNAEVHRDARIVEAEANAEAGVRESASRKGAGIAEIDAKKAVVAADLDFKVQQASWRAGVNQAEEKAKLAGEIAKMEEMRILEERRLEANRLKYRAEVVIPAEAEKEAKQLKAVGEAAFTFEEGRAKAEALRLLREQWDRQESKELFMIQMMPELVGHVSKVIAANLNVEKLTVVDNGGGGGVPSLVGNLAGAVNAFFEQMKTLSGLDMVHLAEEREKRAAERLVVKTN
ncbi:MAG: SPFH domain-containing protein [Syntrophales bacterium]|nr:SPFH domain-containing protein [Syntrophales bacterium]